MDIVYINIKDNHFKIWGCDLYRNGKTEETTAVSYWGKIGLTMDKLRRKVKIFHTYREAYDYMWDKIKEKIEKGYNSIPNSQYFDSVNNNKPLSQLIRLLEIYQSTQDKR